MRWRLLLFVALALVVFALVCVRTYGFVGAPNAGIVVTLPGGWSGGVELVGQPGFFDCSDGGC
jgi:hypothetical protein